MSVKEAWRIWAVESCVEWNGGHAWLATIEGPSISLNCTHCPANADDIFCDATECFAAQFPVEIESHTYQGGPWGPEEYDLWVHLTPKT